MGKRILQILAAICVVIGAGAFAQDRTMPESREQVMLSYAPLVKKVAPAVVNVYTKRVVTQNFSPFAGDPFFSQFFGQGFGMGRGLTRQNVESSLGSGLIVEPEGVVITNAHVIKDAQEISIVLSDGREFDAEKSLVDTRSDLAILRVDTEGERLPFASLKPSESLEVGDIVIAVGNPFGVGQTVTSGIVSALARSSLNINDFDFFIQTDAAINPGNSGGPLIAMDGGVVGINTAIFSRSGGSLGIGFAIPSEMVATVVAAEKAGGGEAKTVARPWLGVIGQAVTAEIAESLDMNRPAGVLVTALHTASPARKAGMEVGDVMIAINGKAIRDPAEMRFRLATVPLGDSAEIDVLRKGKDMNFKVKAAPPPEEPPRAQTALEGAHPFNGVTVANLNPAVASELGLDTDQGGVVVMSGAQGANMLRLVKEGDIISAVNGQAIADVDTLKKALAANKGQGAWNLVIERGGRKSQVVIR